MSEDGSQQRRKSFQDLREQLNLLALVRLVFNAPFHALLRLPGSCGVRFFSWPALLSFIAVPLFFGLVSPPGQQPGSDPVRENLWLKYFLELYLALLTLHWAAFRLRSRESRAAIHSQSGGRSWLNLYGSWEVERRARLIGEPALCGLVGWALRDGPCYPMGCYCLTGAVTLLIQTLIVEQIVRARRLALHDARIEAANNAAMVRDTERG